MWRACPHWRRRRASPCEPPPRTERRKLFLPSPGPIRRKKFCTTSTAESCNTFYGRCCSSLRHAFSALFHSAFSGHSEKIRDPAATLGIETTKCCSLTQD